MRRSDQARKPSVQGPGRSLVHASRNSLLAPIELLLARGGDGRLVIDPETRLNVYGCRVFPRPEVLAFASSTASSISELAYARAAEARQAVGTASMAGEDAPASRIEAARTKLATHLALSGSGAQIVLCPSGTDAQLRALCLVHALLDGPLTSIVVASNETGSGTGMAITGRHFNTRTALGHTVCKGEPVPGFDHMVSRVEVATSGPDGVKRDTAAIDREVINATARAIRAGRKVLLLSMDSSKLGRRCPSEACLHTIAECWPSAVQVVVDACQLRLSRERLARYLASGAIVLLTGSKFFTGPPFSGAVMVPASLSGALSGAVDVPQGLSLYSNRNDWPMQWVGIQRRLPNGYNVGQWLRWEAALAEMEVYFAVPQDFRAHALDHFERRCGRLLDANGFELLEGEFHDTSNAIDDGEFTARSIFPFVGRYNRQPLSLSAAAGLYRALNSDVSARLPPDASAAERVLAATPCHIGQPVAICTRDGAETGALRISADARHVSGCWDGNQETAHDRLNGECEKVGQVLRKARLLVHHQIAL
jgi:hypothetical protein